MMKGEFLMSKRRVVTIFLILAIAFSSVMLICIPNQKAKVPSLKSDTYIYDNARIVEGEDEEIINSLLLELDMKTDAKLLAITVKSLPKTTAEEYAEKVFKEWSLYKFSEDNNYENALLIFNKKEKEVFLKTTSGLSEIPFDKIRRKCFDNHIDKGDFAEAIDDTTKTVAYAINNNYDADITNLHFSGPYVGNPFLELGLIIGTLLICLAVLVLLLNKDRNYN